VSCVSGGSKCTFAAVDEHMKILNRGTGTKIGARKRHLDVLDGVDAFSPLADLME